MTQPPLLTQLTRARAQHGYAARMTSIDAQSHAQLIEPAIELNDHEGARAAASFLTNAVLACFALVACGGAPQAAALPPQAPMASSADTLVLGVSGRTVWACRKPVDTAVPPCRFGELPAAFGDVSRMAALLTSDLPALPDDVPPGDPPGTPPGTDLAMPLFLMFESNGVHVDACLLDGAVFRCARIAAPVPAGVTVGALSLPGDYAAITYVRTRGATGVPDPQGQAALRFQAAFDAATTALRRDAAAHHTPSPTSVDEAEDGGRDIQVVVIPSPGSGDVGTIPVVFTSRDVDTSDNAEPRLPPRDPDSVALSTLLNPCVISPLITVCIRGKRPPPPVGRQVAAPGLSKR